jgi:hypothetical protein
MTMILTLDDVKTQLRLEPDFTEHDSMLTKWWRLRRRVLSVTTTANWWEATTNCRRCRKVYAVLWQMKIIQLAMQYLVGDAYLNGFTGQWLEIGCGPASSFPLQENTV